MNRIAVGLICVLLAGGCATRGIDAAARNRQWRLVKVELDRAAIGNRGGLPIFSDPRSDYAGNIPRAEGFLRINDRGKVACVITIYEPTMGLGGTVQTFRYPVVEFYGYVTEDPTRLAMEDLVAAKGASLGHTTVLHVLELTRGGRLQVQGATGDVLLPYVYYFDPGPTTSLITVPFVDL